MTSLRIGGALSATMFVCALFAGARESAAQSLPSGWQSKNVGTTSGSASVSSSGVWTVTGSGEDIGGGSDAFQFAYQAVTGDVDIRARLTSFDAANDESKAGVMIREGLQANARNAFLLLSPGTGIALQRRSWTAGSTSRTSGGAASAPLWLRLVRQGNTFTAYRSADGQSWTTVTTRTISMGAPVFVGLAVTSRDADDTATATFTNVAVNASSGTGSAPAWSSGDVGSPSVAGLSTVSGGTFSVTGAGRDIWGNADQFQYIYQQMTGDVEVIARLASLQAINVWTKAGVMIRESLAPGSRHAFMAGTGASGWAFQRRIATDGVSDHTAGPSGSAPGWVRLVREGSLFTAYHSTNGSTWTLVGSDTISMPSTAYVGLAVSSHNTGSAALATVTNVTVRAVTAGTNQPPSVTLTAPSAGATYTSPATMALAASASDSDGALNRVEFYRGSTLIGSDATAPYTASWTGATAGTYALTAIAFDNEGASTTSSAVSVTVNAPSNQLPAVSLTSPGTGQSFTAPAQISIAATASDTDGTIARVDLYQGNTLLRSDTASPYTYTWTGVAAGTYQLTAVAVDNLGATRTSSPVSVTVNAPGNQLPTVGITEPVAGASYTAPATMTIRATASDADGTIARVEFYRGTTLIASDTSNPYSATWTSAPSGSYALTARAYDNVGGMRESAAVNVAVNPPGNQLPMVSITAPANGATFTAQASISLAANASDPDGTISRVDFYAGSQIIGTDMSSPYTATWSNVAAGTYSLTAIARDNSGGTRTSVAVSVTVNPAGTPPTSVSFNASADHASGVTSYAVALRRSGDPVTAPPVATRDLGKPSPVSGVITVDISTLVNPLPAGTYYAVVMAIGPGGTSTSTPSGTFTK